VRHHQLQLNHQQKNSKKYEQKFRNEWLHQSEFKDWLAGPSSSYVDPRCFVTCNKTVACHRSGLIKHANSQSHVSLMKSRKGVSSVKALFEQEAQRHCYKETTELQLASFIAEHNLPFTLAKPLLSLVQSTAPQELSQRNSLKHISLSK